MKPATTRTMTQDHDLAALASMALGDLLEAYRRIFDARARAHNADHLRHRIAWRLQEQAECGLSARAIARISQLGAGVPSSWLARAAEAAREPDPPHGDGRDPRLPPIGTVIRRTYRGDEHRVTVLTDRFEYREQRYRSLSQIAKVITGTRWNGYTFFLGNRKGGADAATRTRSRRRRQQPRHRD